MKKEVNIFTAAATLCVVLLMLSSALKGAASTAVYCLSFLIPTAVGVFLERKNAYKEERESPLRLVPRSGSLKLALPAAVPTVALVLLMSFLTALLISSVTGATDEFDVGDSFFTALMLHVVLPALFEEALFRYLPLRLFGGRAPLLAIIISASYFSLAHFSLFRIPYAFLAGAIFMLIDLLCDSPLPSVVIHLLNNLCSLLLVFYGGSQGFVIWGFAVLGLATVASIALIVYRRRDYINSIRDLLSYSERWKADMSPLIYVFPTLFTAISEFM